MGVAAVIPLNYDVNYDGIQEYSVTYASDKWAELSNILRDPVAWFKAKELLHFPGSQKPWDLISPVTALIEPMGATAGQAMRDVIALSHLLAERPQPSAQRPSGENAAVLDFSLLSYEAIEELARDTAAFAAAVQGFFPRGVFVAEFAVNTQLLQIRYVRPELTKDWKPRQPAIPMTHAVLGAEANSKGEALTGLLHFDLRVDEDQRAGEMVKYVLDYIENRAHLATTLLDPPEKLESWKQAFTPEDVDLITDDARRNPLPTDRFSAGDNRPVHVIVMGLSKESIPCPCLQHRVGKGRDGVWYLGALDCKDYTPAGDSNPTCHTGGGRRWQDMRKD